jgi:hypothetical protein
MAEIQKLRAERQVANALNIRNGPNTNAIYNLPPNSPVLVWREGNTGQSGHWDGLFTLLTVKGKTCTVKLSSGPTTFRSIVVKPYLLEPQNLAEIEPELPPEPLLESVLPKTILERPSTAVQPPKRGRGRPRKYPLLTAMADITIYL